jgi:hypothetical protein
VLIIPLLKVKYFSLGDYFSTGLCHNPSYVWRGLWGVKDYLLCGFKSSKSSGENIPMWNQPWLPDAGSYISGFPTTINMA